MNDELTRTYNGLQTFYPMMLKLNLYFNHITTFSKEKNCFNWITLLWIFSHKVAVHRLYTITCFKCHRMISVRFLWHWRHHSTSFRSLSSQWVWQDQSGSGRFWSSAGQRLHSQVCSLPAGWDPALLSGHRNQEPHTAQVKTLDYVELPCTSLKSK